jgi:hypothetical protein
MSSKFVFQPFVLPTVITPQVPLHPVVIVATTPAGTVCVFVVWPAQESVTVVEPEPPLYARMLTSTRGVTNVNVALVAPPLLNEALFVVKSPQGPEWYQLPVPQLMTPVGYWPLST